MNNRYNKKKILVLVVILLIAISFFSQGAIEFQPVQLEMLEVDESPILKNNKQHIIDEQKMIHFSLDDFIIAFEDIVKNNYASIFENDTFSNLKYLHDKYGFVITCYTYFESDDKKFNLSMVPSHYKEQFQENSSWLKFGFHTLNGSTNYEDASSETISSDFQKVQKELLRIVGKEAIDQVLRLQSFASSRVGIEMLRSLDVVGVLGADDKRRSYNLNDEENSHLYLYDYYQDEYGMNYFKTDMRLENIKDLNKELKEIINDKNINTNKILVVFTHEWKLNNEMFEKMEQIAKIVKANQFQFDFIENRIFH